MVGSVDTNFLLKELKHCFYVATFVTDCKKLKVLCRVAFRRYMTDVKFADDLVDWLRS